jgi:hypothetical protein
MKMENNQRCYGALSPDNNIGDEGSEIAYQQSTSNINDDVTKREETSTISSALILIIAFVSFLVIGVFVVAGKTYSLKFLADSTTTLSAALGTLPTSSSTTQYTKSSASRSSSSSSPNIIFILADDMGYGSLDDTIAPFMSGLRDKGIQLENYYAQEACTPSRASLLTGRYPLTLGWNNGVVDINKLDGLGLNETTFPLLLKEAGYETHMYGKWHLGNGSPRYLPTARGFDYYFGYVGPSEYYWSKRATSDSTFHDFMYADSDCYYSYDGDDMKHYSTNLYKEMAVSTIAKHDFTDSPLFMYLAFQAVHEPFLDVEDTFSTGLTSSDLDDSTIYSYIHSTFKVTSSSLIAFD